MKPCKDCKKPTRSHVVGRDHYCHTCWIAMPEEKREDILKVQRLKESMSLTELAARASLQAAIKKDEVETTQLSESVTLVKTKEKKAESMIMSPMSKAKPACKVCSKIATCQCERCKNFVPPQLTYLCEECIFTHIDKEHPEEAGCKDDFIKFEEDYIIEIE